MQTWGIRNGGRSYIIAGNTLEEAMQAIDPSLAVSTEDAVPFEKFEPCASCDHQRLCRGSLWNEGRPDQGYGDAYTMEMTQVHRCPTCLRAGIEKGGGGAAFHTIPMQCPRYSEAFGPSLDCVECLDTIIKGAQFKHAHGDNVVDLAGVRDRSAAIEDMVTATSPTTLLRQWSDDPEARPVRNRAKEILVGIHEADISSVRQVIASLEPDDALLMTLRWLEVVALALMHDDRPEAVLEEWMLEWTNTPDIRRLWVTLPLIVQVKQRNQWLQAIARSPSTRRG